MSNCKTVSFLLELRPDLVNWADRAELAAAKRGIDATMDKTASGGRVYLTARNEHDTGAKLRAWLAEDNSVLTVWEYIDGGE